MRFTLPAIALSFAVTSVARFSQSFRASWASGAEIAADSIHPGRPRRAAETGWLRTCHWFRGRPRVRFAAAAAVAMVAVVAAFWLGTLWRAYDALHSAKQSSESGASVTIPAVSQTSAENPDQMNTTPDARSTGSQTTTMVPPKATSVLRFVLGSEWRPTS